MLLSIAAVNSSHFAFRKFHLLFPVYDRHSQTTMDNGWSMLTAKKVIKYCVGELAGSGRPFTDKTQQRSGEKCLL